MVFLHLSPPITVSASSLHPHPLSRRLHKLPLTTNILQVFYLFRQVPKIWASYHAQKKSIFLVPFSPCFIFSLTFFLFPFFSNLPHFLPFPILRRRTHCISQQFTHHLVEVLSVGIFLRFGSLPPNGCSKYSKHIWLGPGKFGEGCLSEACFH